jgi:hypothetical protein
MSQARSGGRFIGCAVGAQSLKSPINETRLASGATQMKLIGLAIFSPGSD